jgi:hypothetical protein
MDGMGKRVLWRQRVIGQDHRRVGRFRKAAGECDPVFRRAESIPAPMKMKDNGAVRCRLSHNAASHARDHLFA